MNPDPLDWLKEAEPGSEWVVLHSRPRCEKKVVALGRQRSPFLYVPCVKRAHNYGGRTRVFDVPMFTGYVFGQIRTTDKIWFRQNPYVANLLEVVKERPLLHALRGIELALQEQMPLEVLPFLQPGKPVQVIGGPMKGLEAVIAELRGKNRVILHVEMLQQSVAIEVDAAYLKPVL